jgi:hypothetical protein
MVYLFNDSVIAWSSKKQATVTLSTGKAEYVAKSKCTREVVYLRQLLSELDYPQRALMHIYPQTEEVLVYSRSKPSCLQLLYVV